MGQFASSAFNGDPYIDIMRALPDKEIVWWIQKTIWLAQGFTIAEHFGRTYHQLFMHTCEFCNGAGSITCPSCDGYKIVQANNHGHRISGSTQIGELMATMDTKECQHCGDYGPWDNESEWQEKWTDWDSKLAYYDRRYGALFDELQEDLANEGNMDEDTPHMDDVPPAACLTGTFPETDRLVAKMEKQQRSMLARMDGHPYDNDDMMSGKIVDITKPMKENLEAMDLFRADLPPELHPEAFPEYLLMANSPIAAFNNEIRMEYLIMKNLDAALRDSPKPACFAPSAGTVACPACDAHPTYYSFTPNLKKLFKAEQPFWLKTLNNMQQQGTWTRALPTAQGADMGIRAPYEEEMVPSGRQYGEIPRKQYADVEIEEAMKSTAPGLWDFNPGKGKKHLNIPFNGNQVWDHDYEGGWFGHSNKVEGPDGIQGRGPGMPMPADNGDLITEVMEQDFGPGDPLNDFSYSRAKGRKTHAANPLTNNSAAEAEWFYSNMNPAKNLARKVRDLRVLDQADNTEEEEEIMNWLQTRDSLAPEFQGSTRLAAGQKMLATAEK